MILEEIIRSLREKREKLIIERERTEDPQEIAYLSGRIKEIEELLAQLENIA